MPAESLTPNRAVVFGFAVLYWASVYVQARRVRQRIGRSPNVRPRGAKETLLWAGWCFVVLGWLALGWLGPGAGLWPAATLVPLVYPANLVIGTTMMLAGYAFTLWCYVAMGDAWRMGINRKEETQLVTRGPYQRVRHPIYLAQLVMVAAIMVLLPSVLAFLVLAVHLGCVLSKAADEESYLRIRLGQTYEHYRAGTGWWPRMFWPKAARAPGPGQESLKPFVPPK